MTAIPRMRRRGIGDRANSPANSRRSFRTERKATSSLIIPRQKDVALALEGRTIQLTNLPKLFWPEEGITKRDLLQYYADISAVLLPHLRDRAMVMKRYPNGAGGKFFFMKRAPVPRPDWIPICSIEHASGNMIDFPVVNDLPTLLWLVNLGCIDLNPWYARCDDIDRPDYLHFDLDPSEGGTFEQVCQTAAIVHRALAQLDMPCFAKTTGSRGIHLYIPIVRGPLQKDVWTFAKALAKQLEAQHPTLITAEYRIRNRPPGHILIDYNQNAWGRTLASIYSVRPRPLAPVSAPVSWEEIERGIRIEDFRLDNMRERIQRIGDLWEPMLTEQGRYPLAKLLKRAASGPGPTRRLVPSQRAEQEEHRARSRHLVRPHGSRGRR